MFLKALLLSYIAFTTAQAEVIPRPVFSRDRVFAIQPDQQAEKLNVNSRIQAYAFNEAIEQCKLNLPEVQFNLSQVFNLNESTVIGTLKKLFLPVSESHLSKLRVLVDHFGSATQDYRSFHIPPQQNMPSTISIDCKNSSRIMWNALLGHELAHHVNAGKNLSVWMDEMLAQLVEVENSFALPYPRLQKLASGSVVPAFFTTNPVLQSSEQYASNLLFGFYLRQLFGAEVFKDLNRDIRNLKDLSLRLIQFTTDKHEFDWIRNYLSPVGLIRHFHLALNINSYVANKGSVFMVQNWNGFTAGSIFNKGQLRLSPGSSVRLSSSKANELLNLPPELEAYRILKTGTQFKILKMNQSPEGNWSEDFIVLINVSEVQSFEIEL